MIAPQTLDHTQSGVTRSRHSVPVCLLLHRHNFHGATFSDMAYGYIYYRWALVELTGLAFQPLFKPHHLGPVSLALGPLSLARAGSQSVGHFQKWACFYAWRFCASLQLATRQVCARVGLWHVRINGGSGCAIVCAWRFCASRVLILGSHAGDGSHRTDTSVALKVTNISDEAENKVCLLYTSPSPRDRQKSRMPSSA